MAVTAGYKIDRDENGLTENERHVLKLLSGGKNLTVIGKEMELSRQRAAKLAADLVKKGWLSRGEKRGVYMIETTKIAVIAAW